MEIDLGLDKTVNASRVNIASVKTTLSNIIDQIDATHLEDEQFSLSHSLTLTLSDRRNMRSSLLYERKSNNFWLAIQDPVTKKILADRFWDISSRKREIEIYSSSTTQQSWEGNSFGMALILQTNSVIEHIIKHSPSWKHLSVTAYIEDKARASDPMLQAQHKRDKWTMHFATELGYEGPNADGRFFKRYQ